MRNNRPLTLLLLAIPLLVSGCKQKPVKKPDHVIQQEAKKKEKEAEAKKAKAEAKKKPKKKKDEDETWPGPVRLAFYNLHTAPVTQWSVASRRLGLLGMPAVPAFKRLLKNQRQPMKKKGMVAYLLVQLYMFRPEGLTNLARDEEMPFARRGAIEALAIIGNKDTKKAMAAMRQELASAKHKAPKKGEKKAHGHGHGHEHGHGHGHEHGAPGKSKPSAAAKKRPFGPMIDFIKKAEEGVKPWKYDARQLAVLDSVFHAESEMKLKVALAWVKDDSLEQGLMAILRSPVTRPQIIMATIKHLVTLAQKKPANLRGYCEPGYPQMLRMLAAKKLLDLKKPADRAYLQKLAANPRDPVAPFLRAILSGKMPAMMPRR